MVGNNEEVDLSSNANPQEEGDMAHMLRALMEGMASINQELTTMKSQMAPVPLGTHMEQGQHSHHQQDHLPSQQEAYEEARREAIREHTYRPPPINTFARIPPREVHSNLPTPNSFRQHEFVNDVQDEDDLEREFLEWRRTRRRGVQPRERRDHEQDGLGRVKVKIPPFEGTSDADLYMDWETKVEHIWSCHHFSEQRKVQLATLEFNGYALAWWDNLVKERARNMDGQVQTWEHMKALLINRFIPPYYTRELRQRLENLKQGSMSVEEAYNAMQHAMLRANIREDEDSTIARYLRVLNSNIAYEVDMYPCRTAVELLHNAIKIEKRLKSKNSLAPNRGQASASSWKPSYKGVASSHEHQGKDQTGPKKEVNTSQNQGQSSRPPYTHEGSSREVSNSSFPNKSSQTTCFKCKGKGHMMRDCPNTRTMIVDHLGNYDSCSDQEEETCMQIDNEPSIDYDKGEQIEFEHGESLLCK